MAPAVPPAVTTTVPAGPPSRTSHGSELVDIRKYSYLRKYSYPARHAAGLSSRLINCWSNLVNLLIVILIVVRPQLAYRQWEADGKIEARVACGPGRYPGRAQCLDCRRNLLVWFGKDRGWWRAYPAIVSTRDLFGFTIPTAAPH